MLIDVGAGTTDLACFLRVIPSEDGVRQKLVQLGDPISVYAAGNQLDKALDTLATKKICDPHSLSLAKFRNDIRRNKEKLFETGTLKLGGSAGSIELAELLGTRAVKDMKTAIARGVAEIAAHAEKKLVNGHGGHPIDQVAIVFAGGGGEMEFLRTATRQAIKKTLSAKFSAEILDVPTPENYPVDASRTRMAVALGGTCQSEYWPEGRKTPPNGYKSAHLFSK